MKSLKTVACVFPPVLVVLAIATPVNNPVATIARPMITIQRGHAMPRASAYYHVMEGNHFIVEAVGIVQPPPALSQTETFIYPKTGKRFTVKLKPASEVPSAGAPTDSMVASTPRLQGDHEPFVNTQAVQHFAYYELNPETPLPANIALRRE